MPVDSQGNYQMNPQVSRAMDTGAATPAAGTEPDQIVLSRNPDGSWTCDDGDGQPSQHASLSEALDYAKDYYSGGEPDGDEGSEQPDTSQSSEELNG